MNKLTTLIAFAIMPFIVACGGGGDTSSTQQGNNSGMPPQVSTLVPAPYMVSRLLKGTNAPLDISGYSMTTLSPSTGLFTDIRKQTCVGDASYVQNKVTNLVEIYCWDGSTHYLNTVTLELQPGAQIPKGETFIPSVASARDGTSFYGRGRYNYLGLPSSAWVSIVDVRGLLQGEVQFPDYRDNRVPMKMKVVNIGGGAEKLIAVTQGPDFDEIGIHRFDVQSRTFETSCAIKVPKVKVEIGGEFVILTLRRGTSLIESDALVVDTRTCAVKASLRIPVEEIGIPVAQFVTVTDDAIYLGGGSARTLPTPTYGVWKFDSRTLQLVGFVPTMSLPFVGAYEGSIGALWIGTLEHAVLEIDTFAMTIVREFFKPLFGGDMLFVE